MRGEQRLGVRASRASVGEPGIEAAGRQLSLRCAWKQCSAEPNLTSLPPTPPHTHATTHLVGTGEDDLVLRQPNLGPAGLVGLLQHLWVRLAVVIHKIGVGQVGDGLAVAVAAGGGAHRLQQRRGGGQGQQGAVSLCCCSGLGFMHSCMLSHQPPPTSRPASMLFPLFKATTPHPTTQPPSPPPPRAPCPE